jgi:Fe2+ transport system protein FeoA
MQIKELEIGEQAEIVGYESRNPAYRSRLLAMGLTKGTVVKLLKVAPLGDPVEIELRGFNLSLRKDEAQVLRIRRLDDEEAENEK